MPRLAETPEFLRGAALHDAGRFWDAHEAWEALWRAESSDDRRRFLQGLIQVTAAFHKLLVMRNAESAARLLARGLAKLDGLADAYEGVALGALRDGASRCLAVIEAKGALDARSIPRVMLA